MHSRLRTSLIVSLGRPRTSLLQRSFFSTCAQRTFLRQHQILASSASITPQSRRVGIRNYATPTTVVVPTIADSISEGTIKQWTIPEGGFAKTDDIVCTLETDKITVEVKAPHDGIVSKHLFATGSDVRVGQNLFELTAGAAPANAAAAAPKPAAEAPKAAAAPAAPKPAAEAPKAAAAPAAAPAAPKPAAAPQPVAPRTSGSRTENRVKMTKMRARIAERLKDSQNTAAMLTTFNEVDMTNLMELRNKYKEAFEKKHGCKLGFMSGFVKASATALLEFPEVNASIDGKDIIYRDFVDISVAVATPTGLVVPVLRNVEQMSFADIEKTIAALGVRARDGKLTIEEMTGGTFTISNGGVYGSLMGTPIINPPQSAILGMHAINQRAHVVNGEIKARPIMFIALTYDHRIIDGRDAVQFLKKIKTIIEEPTVLLLDL